MYRAIRSGPASTGSKPTSRISLVARRFPVYVSPQYTKLGWVALPRASNVLKGTSLGTELKAATTSASGTLCSSPSAREEVWARTSPVPASVVNPLYTFLSLSARPVSAGVPGSALLES
jgi:hypothetical protein